ncbi:hypothetical protein Rhopal_003222-T1 [Rhodotorula paludigena]|uniref:AB hydrolase-1 domain-containing protein n=1 Tax=Rhodotorula paludigena TaxID=86838 RepID=A0AAV5GJ38_9BASI|nr:hypothetical protein Rhopal_003222-T1 [Rhodotorula paludigena]
MHGLGSSTSFYEAPLSSSRLRQHFRLIRYDFDGHGLSPVSSLDAADEAGMLSIEDLAEDLNAVIDWAGCSKVAGVVGHSMSGLVASTFAARYPEKVDKLVLLGAMRALTPEVQSNMLKRAHTVMEHGVSAVVQQVVASALSDRSKQDSPLSGALVRTLVLGTKPEGYAAACRALAGASDPDYGAIKAETLVIAGEHDYLSNAATSDHLCAHIPRADKVQMDGVGHWHAVEDPVRLREILEGFFL